MENNPSRRRYWLSGKRAAEQDRFFREALDARGWREGDAENWDAGWSTGMPEPEQFRRASARHRLNHFPGNNALTVKSRLYESLARMRQRLIEQFGVDHETVTRLDFFPRTYLMPSDYHALQQAALEQPDKRWILKPTNASKGKGIRVLRDPADIPMESHWLIQEYLENPHTIRKHKYVLRLYVLVSSIEPLRVYVYRQGFAKLASAPYDLDDLDNPYSQLTNPDINALNTEAEVPVEFIDLNRYRQWLREQGHDDEELFARIHDLLTLTVISATDDLRRRTALSGADPRGCYELLGIDCLVDAELKPWVLECNLSPSLGTCAAPENGGREEENIKRSLVEDMLALIGIDELEAIDHGKHGVPTSDTLLNEAQQEMARSGGFLRLFPHPNPARYLPLFAFPSRADVQLASALSGHPLPLPWPLLQRHHVSEMFGEDRLALYASHTGHYYQLNDSAALIWLMVTEGIEPEAIVAHLVNVANPGPDEEQPDRTKIQHEVWECLALWCREGMLIQQGDGSDSSGNTLSSFVSECQGFSVPAFTRQAHIRCGQQSWSLCSDSMPAMTHLAGLLSAQEEGPDTTHSPRIEILRDAPGFTLAAKGEVMARRLPLAEVGASLVTLLMRQTARRDQPVLDIGLLTDGSESFGGVTWLILPDEEGWFFAEQLAAAQGKSLSRGLQLDTREFALQPLGLPGPQPHGHFSTAPSQLPVAIQPQAIVSLHRSLDIGTAEPCQPMSLLDTLASLLPHCIATGRGHLSGPNVERLADWLSKFKLLTLDITDEKEALRALDDALASESIPRNELSLPET